MFQNLLVSVLIFLFSGMFGLIFGQATPATAVKPTVIAGDVVTIADKKIVVNAKAGAVDVEIGDKTAFKKVSAENPVFTSATPGAFTDVGVGDRLTISGFPATDGKALAARSVYFIKKSELDAKAAKESSEWQRRGVTGKVISVNAQTNQIVVETRTLTGTSNVTLTPKENAKFLRYAPDSIRFDEALASSLPEVKAGDMVRALGDKSSDGLSFAAEQIVAGAFQTVAGTVKSVDVAKNEIVIKNLQTNKDVTIMIGDTSVLKRFPAEQAEMLARIQVMGAGGARPMGQGARPVGQGAPPAGSQQGQTPGAGRPGMNGARPGGGIDDMLERSPTITPADLKVGDIIALSSTKTADVARLKAIKLFAGVEPFLRAAQATGGRRGQGGGVEAGFSIPGLDGIGFP
jgi:hypothetical protein